jgi:hypothetical protein
LGTDELRADGVGFALHLGNRTIDAERPAPNDRTRIEAAMEGE